MEWAPRCTSKFVTLKIIDFTQNTYKVVELSFECRVMSVMHKNVFKVNEYKLLSLQNCEHNPIKKYLFENLIPVAAVSTGQNHIARDERATAYFNAIIKNTSLECLEGYLSRFGDDATNDAVIILIS